MGLKIYLELEQEKKLNLIVMITELIKNHLKLNKEDNLNFPKKVFNI